MNWFRSVASEKMGCANSKTEKDEALRLCRERRRLIKQAIDSRYALAAAHVAYTQSLRSIGIALRRYAEAEVLIESSLSTSATDLDKSPSHCSYPSPSPSHIVDVSDSPQHNGSPLSPSPLPRLSYMRTGGTSALTFRVNPSSTGFGDDESLAFPMPPPPPPPDSGSSWDFFDTTDDIESFRNVGHNGLDDNFSIGGWRHCRNEIVDPNVIEAKRKGANVVLDGNNEHHEEEESIGRQFQHKNSEISGGSANRNNRHGRLAVAEAHSAGVEGAQQSRSGEVTPTDRKPNANGSGGSLAGKSALEKSVSKREKTAEGLCAEREDPSEFITHRAKDFLSSIKDIEHRFFRASESGKEVSRLLEANKIRVGYSEAKGSSGSIFLVAFHLVVCCRGKTALVFNEPSQNVTKVITWNRSTSSRSSSSKNPLATASKDDNDDSGSDFIEEFCMIAGSHSSTLDRLYAWERKLYDEVKASESIRKEYDRKCEQLRHQFAKDLSTQIIDKTRAVVKDLHSRIRVALHSVDSISKRIEKMRDEELQPQLVELIQGLTRMWKAMLECHHAQYITISLAYHARSSTGSLQGDSQRQIMAQLHHEIECFGISFADWIKSHTLYVEALNGWLQNCILQPRERSKSRRPFSPRRVLAPPIFVLCRDWSAGIKSLPSDELSDAIKTLLSDLRHLMGQQADVLQKKQEAPILKNSEETESKDDGKNGDSPSNLSCIHTSLTKVLDRLTKFSEASLKMYEDIRQKSEAARIAYSNCRPARF